jgi:hypothetical protein
MDQRFFDRVFLAGRGVQLAGALAGARFGMTRDEARAQAPALWRWAEERTGEFPGALAALQFDGVRLAAVAITFPDDGSALRILTAVWGEPTLADGADRQARAIWIDPASRTRAALRERVPSGSASAEVRLEPVLPLDRLFRALDRRRILGATPADLAAAHGADFAIDPPADPTPPDSSPPQPAQPDPEAAATSAATSALLRLAPTEFAGAPTECRIRFRRGRAASFTVTIDHAWKPDLGPIAFDRLRAQLGRVRGAHGDATGNRWTFAGGVTVAQSPETPRFTIDVSPRGAP